MKDYYYLLGIPHSANLQEIKDAYRKLSKKFHPDKNENDEYFSERFKDIQEAYEILSDDTKRKKYDELRNTQTNNGPISSEKPKNESPLNNAKKVEASKSNISITLIFSIIIVSIVLLFIVYKNKNLQDNSIYISQDSYQSEYGASENEYSEIDDDKNSDLKSPIITNNNQKNIDELPILYKYNSNTPSQSGLLENDDLLAKYSVSNNDLKKQNNNSELLVKKKVIKSNKYGKPKITCLNCDEYGIYFKNFKWNLTYEEQGVDPSYLSNEEKMNHLESLSIFNSTEGKISDIKIRWVEIDKNGNSLNYDEATFIWGFRDKGIDPKLSKIEETGINIIKANKGNNLQFTILDFKAN